MRRILTLTLVVLLTLSISTCSDSGTGTDPDNSNGGEDETTTYTVSITTSDSGTVSPSGENTYNEGEQIEIQANPKEGFAFKTWSGDIESTENPYSLTVDQDYDITANFQVASYPIIVEVSGEGSVTVTPDQEQYEYGTEVDLMAEPNNSDWEFETWDGDTTSTNNPITISVDSSITITGKFANKLFAGGAGTVDNPYKISTVDQVQAINQYPSAHFVQINDIDASETQNWNSGSGFIPIGNQHIPFKGSYNGNNFDLNNITINTTDYYENGVGLFSYTLNASIKNINLGNANISGSSGGSLIGSSENSNISNISASVTISGNSPLGGLVGNSYSGSKIKNCSVNVSMEVGGGVKFGGLAGGNGGTIVNSYSNGSINSNKTSKTHIGGLVGDNTIMIKNSYSTVDITSNSNGTGGLVGENWGGTILNSYAIGNVAGVEYTGGLVGINTNDAEINNSFSIGKVSGQNYVGGIVGLNNSNISSIYWNVETSNQSNAVGRGSSDGTTGLTTSEMTGTSAKDNMPDLDWANIWVTTGSYPALFWEE